MIDYVPWSIALRFSSNGPGWVAAKDLEALMLTTMIATLINAMAPSAVIEGPAAIQALRDAKYDPPLERFHCAGCDHTWDAWVNDDGTLQDIRNVACANDACSRFGQAAELVSEI